MRIPRLFSRTPRTPLDDDSYRAEPGPAEMTRAANVQSILAIPFTHFVTRMVDGVSVTREEPLLPDGPARRLLLAEAATGRDVYAYSSGSRWYVWYGPLAASDPLARDGRIPAKAWAENWDMILLGMARSAPADVTQATGEGWQRAMRKGA